MNESKKLDILKDILGSFENSGKEKLFICPFCPSSDQDGKKKFSINIEKNACKCWRCSVSYNRLSRLIKRLGTYEQYKEFCAIDGQVVLTENLDLSHIFDEQVIAEEKIDINIPKEFISLSDSSKYDYEPRKYLQERGLSERDILTYRIGYCLSGEFDHRILFPSFDQDGRLNYLLGRDYTDSGRKKYWNASLSASRIVFNELDVDWDEPIVLVEGVFDAIKAGFNAIPLLGSTLDKKSKLFYEIIKNDSIVYLALDPDARVKQLKICKNLLRYGVEVYIIDVNRYKDVGEMDRDEFNECKGNALMVNEEYLLKYELGMV